MKRLAAAAAALALTASAAHADWQSNRTFTGPNGVTTTSETTSVREGNTRTVTTVSNNSNGGGATRTATSVWDPVTRTWTRDVTGTTARGGTWSNTGGGGCANGVCEGSSTYVGPRGTTIDSTSRRARGEAERSWTSSRGGSGHVKRTWRRVK